MIDDDGSVGLDDNFLGKNFGSSSVETSLFDVIKKICI